MKQSAIFMVKLLIKLFSVGALLIGIMRLTFFFDWAPEVARPPLTRTDFAGFAHALDQLLIAGTASFDFHGQLAVANLATQETLKREYGHDALQSDFDRRYLLGSISKTITAILIGQLFDNGALHENDRYCAVMKLQCSEKASRITVKALLDHQSGLPRLSMSPIFGNIAGVFRTFLQIDPKNSGLEALKTFDAIEPEPKFQYSNLGFRLLTYLLEKHFNASFKKIVETHVAERYRLPSFTVADHEHPQGRSYFPIGITKHASILVPSDKLPLPKIAPYGDGAVVGSLNDLVTLSQRIVDRNLFQNPHIHSAIFDGEGDFYANGVLHGTDANGEPYLFHNGSFFGCETFFYIFPRQKVAVVMLSNLGYHRNEIEDFVYALNRAVEGGSYEAPNGVRTIPALNF